MSFHRNSLRFKLEKWYNMGTSNFGLKCQNSRNTWKIVLVPPTENDTLLILRACLEMQYYALSLSFQTTIFLYLFAPKLQCGPEEIVWFIFVWLTTFTSIRNFSHTTSTIDPMVMQLRHEVLLLSVFFFIHWSITIKICYGKSKNPKNRIE